MKKKGNLLNIICGLILLSPLSCLSNDAYSSAYGQQAIMSPASTSLSFGQSPQSQQAPYQAGNGVYLTGQPAIMPPQNAQMPQFPSQAQPYPQQQMGQSYTPSSSPLDNSLGYGGNTYTAYKPVYGQPPQMVQRNSANYPNYNSFPYRQNPNITLNPNSQTGQNNATTNMNPTVTSILNGTAQQPKNPNFLQRVLRRPATTNTNTTNSSGQKFFSW